METKEKSTIELWREANPNHVAERLDPLEKAKRNPKSKVLAIRAYCYDCCGGVKTEVTLCPSTNCPLWLHRPWQSKDKHDNSDDLE